MDEPTFWRLMEEARDESGGDREVQVAALERKLPELPPAEIVEFHELFNDLHVRSYDWGLWAAAYVINHGCGDDGFDYFRAWLISKGREFYTKAIEVPDSLADLIPEHDRERTDFEVIMYAPNHAYQLATGEDLPLKRYRTQRPRTPRGTRWLENEDDLKKLVPRLFERFWTKGHP